MEYFEMRKFMVNDIIFEENDESNYIYFIKSGEIEVVLTIYFIYFKDFEIMCV